MAQNPDPPKSATPVNLALTALVAIAIVGIVVLVLFDKSTDALTPLAALLAGALVGKQIDKGA